MGSVGASKNVSSTERYSGDISYADMITAREEYSDGGINFNKGVTVLPQKYLPESGLKRDLGALLDKYNMNIVVINMYRDRAGANDLKRMQDLGFEIVAQYKGEQQAGSRVPPKDYYYMRRKK